MGLLMTQCSDAPDLQCYDGVFLGSPLPHWCDSRDSDRYCGLCMRWDWKKLFWHWMNVEKFKLVIFFLSCILGEVKKWMKMRKYSSCLVCVMFVDGLEMHSKLGHQLVYWCPGHARMPQLAWNISWPQGLINSLHNMDIIASVKYVLKWFWQAEVYMPSLDIQIWNTKTWRQTRQLAGKYMLRLYLTEE